MIATSEVSVSFTTDRKEPLDRALADLEKLGDVRVETGKTLMVVVGRRLAEQAGLGAAILQAVADAGVNVEMVSYGMKSISLTMLVADEAWAPRPRCCTRGSSSALDAGRRVVDGRGAMKKNRPLLARRRARQAQRAGRAQRRRPPRISSKRRSRSSAAPVPRRGLPVEAARGHREARADRRSDDRRLRALVLRPAHHATAWSARTTRCCSPRNFSGSWPGLVGLLNTGACLESLGRAHLAHLDRRAGLDRRRGVHGAARRVVLDGPHRLPEERDSLRTRAVAPAAAATRRARWPTRSGGGACWSSCSATRRWA